jgi:hypothetical protein
VKSRNTEVLVHGQPRSATTYTLTSDDSGNAVASGTLVGLRYNRPPAVQVHGPAYLTLTDSGATRIIYNADCNSSTWAAPS